jgi:hypothetical protein
MMWLRHVPLFLALLAMCTTLNALFPASQAVRAGPQTNRQVAPLHFKKPEDKNNGDEGSEEKKDKGSSMWQGLKRFLPGVSRATFKEHYKDPQPDIGNRYYIRLLQPEVKSKRHVTTRLLRYLPDMSWGTAEGIVETAIEEGISLIRIVNSQVQCATAATAATATAATTATATAATATSPTSTAAYCLMPLHLLCAYDIWGSICLIESPLYPFLTFSLTFSPSLSLPSRLYPSLPLSLPASHPPTSPSLFLPPSLPPSSAEPSSVHSGHAEIG